MRPTDTSNMIAKRLRRHKELREESAGRENFQRHRDDVQNRKPSVEKRNREILTQYVQGVSVPALAAKYSVKRASIENSMARATRTHHITAYQDKVFSDLIPKALAVFDNAMDDVEREVNPEVIKVATRILDATGVLPNTKTIVTSGTDETFATLEEYRMVRLRRDIQTERIALEASCEPGSDGAPRVSDPVLDGDCLVPEGSDDHVQELPGDGGGEGAESAGGLAENA